MRRPWKLDGRSRCEVDFCGGLRVVERPMLAIGRGTHSSSLVMLSREQQGEDDGRSWRGMHVVEELELAEE
jgi:hypothetical protein